MKFGRWTVIQIEGLSRVRPSGERLTQWLCRCECGTERVLDPYSVKTGNSKSCGCLNHELTKIRNRTHGMSKTPIYYVWRAMIDRCENPKNIGFPTYGGRGITVCEHWHRFENFFADMGQRPTPRHTIDRENNSLGYNPENCRWATMQTQQRNRRNNHWITIGDRTLTLAEWAEIGVATVDQIAWRLRKGWDPYRAIFTETRWGKAAA